MVAFARDVEIVAPLWQGSGEAGLGAGSRALAEWIVAEARRLTVPADEDGDSDDDDVRALSAVAAHLDAVRRTLGQLDPSRTLTLGGDCTVEVAPVSHLAARHPELRVLWIDAHADLNDPATSPSGLAHGMPLRLLLGDGHPDLLPATTLSPDRCALVGVRDIDPAERELITRRDIAWFADPASHEVATWLPAGAPVYLHLDLDVLDPAIWPAVALPTPRGSSVQELAALIAAVRERATLVGIGITEYLPRAPHDLATLEPVFAALGLTTTG
ncbi:Formimidoylglutamase [Baekduia alba]|nr:Formimidoylglutamase [Baekduia alba]